MALERLGEFSIKKQLGEGGMGAVYLAYQESLDRDVALKVLNDRLCKNEKFIARFKREARSAASIIHPNVIQIYSIGEDDGVHFFAMEHVRGKDLTELVEGGRTFSVVEVIDIVMQVAEACACASEAGIVHRDIKPANIMMDERGRVKVTDFGLAKTVSSDLDVTEAGTIVGTANYMSPEQGQGKPLDCRSDIYSLGVVFFELLAGRVPFIADQPSAVLYMHVYEPPPAPSKFNRDVPPPVDRMVLRMLAKKPEDRPADPFQLLAELRGLRQSLGVPSHPGRGDSTVMSATGERPASSAILPVLEETEVPSQSFPPGALKILVADDVASVRKLYNRVATDLGFEIVEAVDGEQALASWTEHHPDLVLLDINMPKLSGVEVLAKARERNLGGAVIAISARKDRDTVRAMAGQGIKSYLTKPVNINELRARISKVMDMPDATRPEPESPPPPEVPEEESPAAAADDGSAGPSEQALEKRHIVVFDTATYARSLYRGILESMGHQVACVETLADTEAILRESDPDLLVLAVGSVDEEVASILEDVKRRETALPVVIIAEEQSGALRSKMLDYGLGPVLTKPVRLGDFRAAVEKALAGRPFKAHEGNTSSHFSRIVNAQLQRDYSYTIFDFARELAGVLPAGARKSFEHRLQDGSLREVQAAVNNLLRRLKTDGKADLAMRYVRHAYVNGNLEVRNYCLALLPELLSRKEEIAILLKVVTDEDFRIRRQVLLRLGELQAEEGVETIVRFLNDDVWKVRKAAAGCLERFDLTKVIEPLIFFYARSGEPLPDRIRNRLIGDTGAKEMNLLESLARRGGTEVRAFVAKFLGDLRSKLAVRILLQLIRDKSPTVRSAAARSCGRVNNDKLRDALLQALTEKNSEVQAAVIAGLRQYRLTPPASVFLAALAARGRRIPEEAVRFLLSLDKTPARLGEILTHLDRQTETARKYISLLLGFLYPDSSELNRVVRSLHASEEKTKRSGMDDVMQAVERMQAKIERKSGASRA